MVLPQSPTQANSSATPWQRRTPVSDQGYETGWVADHNLHSSAPVANQGQLDSDFSAAKTTHPRQRLITPDGAAAVTNQGKLVSDSSAAKNTNPGPTPK